MERDEVEGRRESGEVLLFFVREEVVRLFG